MEMFDEDSALAEGLLVEEPELPLVSPFGGVLRPVDVQAILAGREAVEAHTDALLAEASEDDLVGMALLGLAVAGLIAGGIDAGIGTIRAIVPELREGPGALFLDNAVQAIFALMHAPADLTGRLLAEMANTASHPTVRAALDRFIEAQKEAHPGEIKTRSPEEVEAMRRHMRALVDEGVPVVEAARSALANSSPLD